MSKTNLPGFTADSSLCKARERYAAVKCFAQTERAIQLQQIAYAVPPALFCPPGFRPVSVPGREVCEPKTITVGYDKLTGKAITKTATVCQFVATHWECQLAPLRERREITAFW